LAKVVGYLVSDDRRTTASVPTAEYQTDIFEPSLIETWHELRYLACLRAAWLIVCK